MFTARDGLLVNRTTTPTNTNFVIRITTNNGTNLSSAIGHTSANNQFRFPGVGTYTIQWGDGNTQTVTGPVTHTYASIGSYTVNVSGNLSQVTFGTPGTPINWYDSYKVMELRSWGNMTWSNAYTMFYNCQFMIGNITEFNNVPNLSNASNAYGMFLGCANLNADFSRWDVSNITDMSLMFGTCRKFNSSLNSWNVSKVTQIGGMFNGANTFNQDLNNWDVSNVINARYMFSDAEEFNGNISNWNTSNLGAVDGMFRVVGRPSNFNQNLGNWNISSFSSASQMFDNSAMSTENYSKTLIGWANQSNIPASLTLGANGMTYSNVNYGGTPYSNAVAARTYLDTGTPNWTFVGDSQV